MRAGSRARVLLAVHNADSGGAQLMALEDARHLSRDFELVVSIPDGPLREEFARLAPIERPSRSLPIWGASPLRWALQSCRALADGLRLARLIRRRGIQVVLVNSTVLLGPVIAARLAGVPSIVHVREFPMTLGGRIVFRLHGLLAGTLIPVSGAVRAELPEARGVRRRTRIVQIPDGIPIPPPARGNGSFHAPLRLCVIGSINGLRSKGQDVAVAAMAHLKARGVDARLDLVGPISDQAFAEELRSTSSRLGVGDRVRITGESLAIDEVISETDIVLMCSRVEPLGLVPAEALARQRPVIASRTGGLSEVVLDGVTGVLVRPGDPRALGEAVAEMASCPEAAREMTQRGREDIAERFDIERSLRALQEEVESALDR